MINILLWIVFGLIAGLIAKAIMPGRDPGGVIITILLGIVGSIVGGFIGRQVLGVGAADTGFNLTHLLFAIIGAIVVLGIYRLITGRSVRA